jgi:hypothetical protein
MHTTTTRKHEASWTLPTVEIAPIELQGLRSRARRPSSVPADLEVTIEVTYAPTVVVDASDDDDLDEVIRLLTPLPRRSPTPRYPRYTRPQPLRWLIRGGAVAAVLASVVAAVLTF